MSWIAVGTTVASVGSKVISGAVAKKKAKKKAAKEEKKLKAQADVQQKEMAAGYQNLQQAHKDAQNQLKGQTSISPEAQYARNTSERATASAIERATRSGGSAGEIMNLVSGLTAKGQQNAQELSVGEEARRKEAQSAAAQQAIEAAQAGLAGKQAKLGIDDSTYGKIMQTSTAINQAQGEWANYMGDAIGDAGSSIMLGATAGGTQPLDFSKGFGGGADSSYGVAGALNAAQDVGALTGSDAAMRNAAKTASKKAMSKNKIK